MWAASKLRDFRSLVSAAKRASLLQPDRVVELEAVLTLNISDCRIKGRDQRRRLTSKLQPNDRFRRDSIGTGSTAVTSGVQALGNAPMYDV
jgi:hypothetical protein